jgi:hypothetical protein
MVIGALDEEGTGQDEIATPTEEVARVERCISQGNVPWMASLKFQQRMAGQRKVRRGCLGGLSAVWC